MRPNTLHMMALLEMAEALALSHLLTAGLRETNEGGRFQPGGGACLQTK